MSATATRERNNRFKMTPHGKTIAWTARLLTASFARAVFAFAFALLVSAAIAADSPIETIQQAVNNATTTTISTANADKVSANAAALLHRYGMYAFIFLAFLVPAVIINRVFHLLARRSANDPGLAHAHERFASLMPVAMLVLGGVICLRSAFPIPHHGRLDIALTFACIFLFLLAFLRPLEIFFFDYYCRDKKQWTVPRLIRDTVRIPAYALALAYAYKQADPAAPLETLFATSAVLSFILGLALQDTLSNLFAGLAIHFEGSFAIGDWVEIGTKEGEVASMTWRAIKVRTPNNDYLILPNSTIAKGEIINHSQPIKSSGQSLDVTVHAAVPPYKVEEALLEIALDTPGLLPDPAPSVFVRSYGDNLVVYGLSYHVNSLADKNKVRNKINRDIWYRFHREGIPLTSSTPTLWVLQPQSPAANPEETLREKVNKLRRVDFLAALGEDDLENLAQGLRHSAWAGGETILRQGAANEKFFIIDHGEVIVEHMHDDGESHHLANLQPGDFFGEHSLLTGEPTTALCRCSMDTEVSFLPREAFERMLENHPQVAEQISQKIAERAAHRGQVRQSALEKQTGAAPHSAEDAAVTTEARSLLGKIRQLFRLK